MKTKMSQHAAQHVRLTIAAHTLTLVLAAVKAVLNIMPASVSGLTGGAGRKYGPRRDDGV